jgi:hypothetical protein
MRSLDRFALSTLLLGAPAALAAQERSDSAAFIVLHAADTVAIERYGRTVERLQGTLAIRGGKEVSQSWMLALAPDETAPLVEVSVREDADSSSYKSPISQRARVIFKGDSAAVDEMSRRGMQTRLFQTREGAVPYLNLSFALMEQAVRRALRSGATTSEVPFFNLGGGQTVTATVRRMAGDSVHVLIGTVDFQLQMDGDGHILRGGIPSQALRVERLAQ